ncbi:hypothetical protein B0H21DRAFT_833405 [Amylocystis lapponica]|nr:hypothetical protein B0H21DRAFT_833405 [Amylocystis lapponica]
MNPEPSSSSLTLGDVRHPDPEYDMMHELREVTSTPTPLAPSVIQGVSGETQKREKEKDSDTASILTLVLAEKERQAHHLKAILRSTGERLEYEIRRADQAETRTRSADDLAQTSSTRVTAAETGRHQAELDAARAREEIKRYQILAETAERELRRAETDVLRAERLRSNAEQSAADAKDIARKAQQSLREQQAREEGREEGRRLEVRRRYNDGREDSFEDGCAQGYEAGHTEGLEAGRAEGYADRRGRMPVVWSDLTKAGKLGGQKCLMKECIAAGGGAQQSRRALRRAPAELQQSGADPDVPTEQQHRLLRRVVWPCKRSSSKASSVFAPSCGQPWIMRRDIDVGQGLGMLEVIHSAPRQPRPWYARRRLHAEPRLDRHASPRDGGTFRVQRRAHAALGEDREPWLQGGNVALGYWENAQTTTQTSISGGCRRTVQGRRGGPAVLH